MTIRTQDDWWNLATDTVPLLPDYARKLGFDFDLGYAKAALSDRSHTVLKRMFEKLWRDLPDTRSIRHYPFGNLCDLCSEYWVFEDEHEEADVEVFSD
jgi:hypothetical protein